MKLNMLYSIIPIFHHLSNFAENNKKVLVNAGEDQVICDNKVQLNADPPTSGTGTTCYLFQVHCF